MDATTVGAEPSTFQPSPTWRSRMLLTIYVADDVAPIWGMGPHTLDWVGSPEHVPKVLLKMIWFITENKPVNSFLGLRYGPEVETQEDFYTREIRSRVSCRYYYLKHKGTEFGEIPCA